MEINTIIGIVVAIIIMLVGLRMILKKPNHAEPSLDSDLHINPESNQPVIPRHVRDQLEQAEAAVASSAVAERVEPTLSEQAQPKEQETKEVEQASQTQTDQTQAPVENTPIEEVKAEENTASPTVSKNSSVELTDTVSAATEATSSSEEKVAEEHSKAEPELSLNPNIETAEIAEFEGESNILDVHLHEQQRFDDESALAMAEQIIALNVYPNPRRALSGDKALKVLLKYGLRYGEMSCFHRYENTDEPSALMFSVLRMTDNGPAGFDLETLSAEQVQGLAFFLALPNSKAVTGFDMMTSIAGLIAREIDGKVYDENNLEFTPQLKEHWRHHVIDYRPAQATA
ncbi:cell division protein ZipA C-terminal FtsZ-binding domain-containing protein [Acinetobacter nosocomialis]|uniref:cell division protein ZipA C-terminal FtsZ-binding domain-containing protein n=1 Tax=Acinetobacter nosocomialis TaxID=106654 RepID=UPI0003B2A177|nr:cell division protein ZipA C-terminal FtsZ-binding domain-containing protein [Acinetobacter nosocomialis]MCE7533514.1 cell division protein ZipA [Acinetobacter nosocomialis]MDH2592857.1 cell division protein ZipA C-terminal FtsZ-binding domain-containing protein [Acinetobacter nosocomialis]MDH2636418.1 cell division protein ZipA C-terminal FtsZ-binding domain-containing protein [Acinetobacter nosocomialis]MDO7220052.1 cell division protein ZipA C-terminal FtsZ-binding domain-containing prote